MDELRRWFLEMDLTLDEGVVRITTTTTNNLEYHIHSVNNSVAEFFFFNNLFSLFYFLTLQYSICFAIYQNESATGIHVFPILNPPPSSVPIPPLWVVPVHQPQASSIVHQTWTGNSFQI